MEQLASTDLRILLEIYVQCILVLLEANTHWQFDALSHSLAEMSLRNIALFVKDMTIRYRSRDRETKGSSEGC